MRIGVRAITIVLFSILIMVCSGTAWAQGPGDTVWLSVSSVTTEGWGPGCNAGSTIYYESTPKPQGRVYGASGSSCGVAIWHIGVTGTFEYGSGDWSRSVDRYGLWSSASVQSPQFVVPKGTYLVQTGEHRFDDPQWGSWTPRTRVSRTYR